MRTSISVHHVNSKRPQFQEISDLADIKLSSARLGKHSRTLLKCLNSIKRLKVLTPPSHLISSHHETSLLNHMPFIHTYHIPYIYLIAHSPTLIQ
jgi:hypothetical protein